MKKIIVSLFEKELFLVDLVKTLRLKDFSVTGLIISLVVMIVNLVNDQIILVSTFNSLLTILIAFFVLLMLYYHQRKQNPRDVQAFVFIQTSLLFLIYLFDLFFPLKGEWLKVLLSVYVMYQYMIFIMFSLKQPKTPIVEVVED